MDDPVDWYNTGIQEIGKIAENADETAALWLDLHMFVIMNIHFGEAAKQNVPRFFNAHSMSIFKDFRKRDLFTPCGKNNLKYLPKDSIYTTVVGILLKFKL